MKIKNDTPIPTPPPTAGQAERTIKAKKAHKAYAKSATAPTVPIRTDRVEVSDTGQAMQNAAAALKRTPQIRADKVAALKARIHDGTYQVSGADIAERMLADDLSG
jgi:negative regulator of flagellin synthesis FlgM